MHAISVVAKIRSRRFVPGVIRTHAENSWGWLSPDAVLLPKTLKASGYHSAIIGKWHLGLTEGAKDETKARYAFVFGGFRRIHRMGIIACHYRAAEWGHKEIELAAHRLLQYFDKRR